MRPIRKIVEDATLIETIKAAATLVGHELPPHLQAMHSNDFAHEADSSEREQSP
jgi:hypothetical protein